MRVPYCVRYGGRIASRLTLSACLILFVVAVRETSAQGADVHDTFTGSNGGSLTAHTPDAPGSSGWQLWGPPCCAPTVATVRHPTAVMQNGEAILTNSDGAWFDAATLDAGRSRGTVAVDWI